MTLLTEKETTKINYWEKYCSFTNMDISDFKAYQEEQLLEQLKLLRKSEIGLKFLGISPVKSVPEFIERAPLTTYEDYASIFNEKREDILPQKPDFWAFTAGKNGINKWLPFTSRMLGELSKNAMAAIHLSSFQSKENFAFSPADVLFYSFAPPPYLTGYLVYGVLKEFPFEMIPPCESSEKMEFKERLVTGFKMALEKGLSGFIGLSSVLVKMAEEFLEKSGKIPSELFNIKGIVAYGLDTSMYKSHIEKFWGKKPLEIHTASEVGILAMQMLDHAGMTLLPNVAFYEFIPEKELYREKKNLLYKPSTVQIDNLIPGERYEIVITSFFGGSLIRYRLGHIIRLLSLSNPVTGVKLPQIAYESRADEVIDPASSHVHRHSILPLGCLQGI